MCAKGVTQIVKTGVLQFPNEPTAMNTDMSKGLHFMRDFCLLFYPFSQIKAAAH